MMATKKKTSNQVAGKASERLFFEQTDPTTTGFVGPTATPVAAATAKPPLRTPVTDDKGNITGYMVTTYNADGTPNAPTWEKGTAAPVEKSTSAFDTLNLELTTLGLGTLAGPLKKIFESGVTGGSQLSLALMDQPEYQTRFSANAERIKKGLAALTPAQYIAKEDAYQNIMRQYGLPASYYAKDTTGKQAGFDSLLANDVSALELEDRVVTAQNRVLNSNPEVLAAIKDLYGDSVTNGDILAYALDPSKALTDIKKKVTAAEIQGAANTFGLNKITAESTPEEIKQMEARANALAGYGVNKEAAMTGYQTIASTLPRASMLSDIYDQGPYTQATAEAEVFNTAGSVQAAEKRKKISELEKAAFSGSSGAASNALSRDRAISNQSAITPGAGSY